VPEQLCRFVAAGWPREEDPFRAWSVARLELAMEHDDTPALGDPVEVMRENDRTKRRLEPEGAVSDSRPSAVVVVERSVA